MNSDTLIIWDACGQPPEQEGTVYCWNGYAEKGSRRSLLRFIETHGERIRLKYLSWIHELGETRLGGRRLVEHLALDEGFSYWWMTLLAEKSFYKTPSINEAIRLIALEEVIVEHKPHAIRLVSGNRGVRTVVADLCRSMKIPFQWEHRAVKATRSLRLANLRRMLPEPLGAVMSLTRYTAARWALRAADRSGWHRGHGTRFFCSYFIHLDARSCDRGDFHSRHWEELPGMLHDAGHNTNWLQQFLPSGMVPSTAVALRWVRGFNEGGRSRSFHSFLDAYLSPRIVFRVLIRWLWLNVQSWRLRDVKGAFRPPGSQLSLWPVMRSDWRSSLRGSAAMDNLLWIELLDAVLRDLPRQEIGLYLLEGQGWERAFVHAWRKHGHGKLIGVAHSTVRFWDLRNFADPRSIREGDSYPMPRPDITALNGKAAVDAFRFMGYAPERIAECEAVRYGYLQDFPAPVSSGMRTGEKLRVLILGDVMAGSTNMLLRSVEAATSRTMDRAIYTVKPHPNCMVQPKEYPLLSLRVVTEPLRDILGNFDVACASDSTSAGLDAYLAGLRVIVMLDETGLNVSPLRGQPDVRFVSTSAELAEALLSASPGAGGTAEPSDFFFLDRKLPRWKALLAPMPAIQ